MMFRNFYHSLLFLLLISINNIYGQIDSLKYKNEFGFNVGNISIIALGANNSLSQPLEVCYRRSLNNKLFVKTYFQHKNQFPLNEKNHLQYIEVVDTNYLNLHYSSIERWSRAFALGVEYRNAINNWGIIYGLNLKYVNYRNQVFNYYHHYKYDTGALHNPFIISNNIIETIYKKGDLTIDKTIGLEPNIGLFFNVSKRFIFITQTRLYMGYGTQRNFHQDYIAWYSITRTFKVFRYDTDPIISEFSINYKF